MISAKTESTIDIQKVAEQWPDFTNLELEHLCKNVRLLMGGLQAKYGISQDEAARQIQDAYTQIVKRNTSSSEDDQ